MTIFSFLGVLILNVSWSWPEVTLHIPFPLVWLIFSRCSAYKPSIHWGSQGRRSCRCCPADCPHILFTETHTHSLCPSCEHDALPISLCLKTPKPLTQAISSEVNPMKPHCRDRCWNYNIECELKGSSFMFKGTSADNIPPQPHASPLPSPSYSRWRSHKGIECVRHFLWASSENKPGPL